jgi:hypothetical protein
VSKNNHRYRSSMVEPTLDPGSFNRGWITEPELALFVGSLEEAAALKASTFVELGTQYCGSALCVKQVLDRLGREARLRCADVDPETRCRFDEAFAKSPPKSCSPSLYVGNSWDLAQHVTEPVAWVFIDACHCRKCVEKDIAAWAPKVVPGGLMLFHDCDYRVQQRKPGSQRMAHEPRDVGVYDAMMLSLPLHRDFYLVAYIEGALDKHDQYYDGLAVWRRKG